MKTVILAGGFGTRITEKSHMIPKPMIEIGDQPILWHIMKSYSVYGFNDFIICAGYKQHVIKEYFHEYCLHRSDLTFDFADGGKMTVHNNVSEPWKVTVIDTGLNTMTGGRIKRVQKYIGNETFMLTYGDGVSDVPIDKLVAFHRKVGKFATLTAVQPEGRFGFLDMDGNIIKSFREKSHSDVGWINGGFMVLEPAVFDYIDGDETVLEKEPLERLAGDRQMNAYKHDGFWQCMDTMRDKILLDKLWAGPDCPWKKW
jgi:glucose-1-phosphate cytidylyltransferase